MHRRALLLLAALAVPAPAGAQTVMSPPDAPAAKALVQSTMATFAQAVNAKDMTSLYAAGSKLFQQQMSVEKLDKAFAPFIRQGIDLSAAATLEPVLSLPPEVNADGVLTLKGSFVGKIDTWFYRFRYVYEYPDWKLLGISVNSDPI